MSVPASQEPRDGDGRWETIRYALDSNARTFRYCAMVTVSPAAVAVIAELIRHILLGTGSSAWLQGTVLARDPVDVRLCPGGIVVMFTDWRRLPDDGYAASTAGLRPCACVAWVRTRPGTGGLFRASWDPILIASRGSAGTVPVAGTPLRLSHSTGATVQAATLGPLGPMT